MATKTKTLVKLSQEEVLNFTKADIERFALNSFQAIQDGEADLIQMLAFTRKAKASFEALDSKLTDELKSVGVSQRMDVHNMVIEPTNKTEYDYSNCNDLTLQEYESALELLQLKIKQRKDYLKAMKKPEKDVNFFTAEEYIIYPAVKKSTASFKVTINEE